MKWAFDPYCLLNCDKVFRMESGVKGRWDLLKAEVMGAPQVKQSDIKALQEAAAEFEEEPLGGQKQPA